MTDIFSIANRVLKIAEEEGADHCEVYIMNRNKTDYTFEVKAGKKTFNGISSTIRGIAIRAAKGGKLGFGYSSDFSEEALRFTIRSVLSVAEETQGFEGFTTPKTVSEVKGTYDDETANLSIEKAMELIDLFEDSIKGVNEDILILESSLRHCVINTVIVNTAGVEVEEKGTYIGIGTTLSVKGKEKITYPFNSSRRTMNSLDLEKLGETAANDVLRLTEKKSIETGDYEVILSPKVLAELLSYSFTTSLCADQVQAKLSVLEGKVGEKIASEKLTLYDDGTYEEGLYTTKFDDEGTPTQKTLLIEKGVLKGFLYDSITANIDNVESTGNCVRWEPPTWDVFFARSFSCRPRVWMSNLVIEPGSKKLDELVGEISKGLFLLNIFSGFTMSPSGDFNLPVVHGYIIEKGEITGAIKEATIQGNVFETLKGINAVGADIDIVIPDSTSGSLISPHIRLEKLKVISAD